MKIRHKLFLGFGLYILLAAVGGAFSYRELRTMTTRLTLVEVADDTTNTILEVRRFEKNFLLYRDRNSLDELKRYLGTLKRDVRNISAEIKKEIGPDNYTMMKNAIAEYESLIDRVALNYGSPEEKDLVERLRMRAREIQSLTEDLSKRERANISEMLRMSMNILLFALLASAIAGILINIKLARSIAAPIRELEKATKKVAMGDFSEVIEVKGTDEITSLEISFNQMEDKLKDSLSSLELAVRNLHDKQNQLVEAEKLASIGIFAAGIAHEINNPLTSVLTFSHLMLEQMPEGDPRRETLKMMTRETERARIIVRQLLSFAKETPLKTVRTNVNCPINEIIETLSAQGLFDGIEVGLNFAGNLPEIQADPVKLEQVVLNILLNAIHSITPPGKIEVITRTAGHSVEILISDTGCGIPEEYVGKIFDPFYTTKESTKGTGLGLAVSYGIIKKHGGEVEVKSIPGKGSTFVVRLPIHG